MMEVSHSMEEPDGNSVVKRLSVPIGLEELMTSLTKEVLKKKPMDIYNFASDHFTQLLSLREDGNYPEPTAKIITYINNVDFKTGSKNEKQSKDKQLARQVSLNVQPFIQNFKIVGKKSELKLDKRNKKEEVIKQKNEKLKLNKKKSLSKLDQEKTLNLQNDNKNKSKESNSEVNKKSKKGLDKTLPSKGKSTKIKKRVKSVDNFTSFSTFSKNHNIIDPEDIQINSLDKDTISLSSENINSKNYDPLALRKELIKIQDESKFTSFTTTYNPYKLRQEIKSVSLDETTTTTDGLESKFLKDDVAATNNETIKVENEEEKDCSINESDKAKDVILDKNSNFFEGSVIEKKEIENLEANEVSSTADPVNEHNHDKDQIKENDKEEDNLIVPPETSNVENTYNASKIFASAGLAAVKIQSMWRGFNTRKSFPVTNNNKSNLENKDETSSKFSGLNNEMILNAATKIQAGVRGYLSRKQNKKVADAINDEKQDNELKEERQNIISNNKNEFYGNLIETNEDTQEISLVTANLNSNVNDDISLTEDESTRGEIKDAAANNKDLTEIEIVSQDTTDGLDQSTELSSLQEVTESNIQTVIENEESNSISNEIDIKNIESEVKEETSKIVENLPKFEETTINENLIDEIVPTELNKNSEIIENIEKNVIIKENVNNKDLEEKSIASELDTINLPSTTTETNLKSENNDDGNEAADEKKLESSTTENVHVENESVNNDTNLTENIDKEIILDIKNVSDNNTGSTELITTINDENFVNENENNKQEVREKRSVNFQEIIEEENNKLIDSLNNSKNIAINNEPKMSEINKEIETPTNEHLLVVMQPEVVDGIEDENNEEFQKDSKTEQVSIESNSSLGSILQHSGELHDTPTYFNEESKLSSDSISEDVVKEDRKSLLNLEHSGELHDLVIVEKNNNPKNETGQSEESNTKSIEHKLQEEDRLNDKDHKKCINIIEDSKVENFEENYEIIIKDTSGLYDIEELIESDDRASVNPEDGNVVSQLTEVNIDRKEFDKEPESEEKEKLSLDGKAESEDLLQHNEENIKSDDDNTKILTKLHEMEKLNVPEDDLIQSENEILQLTELPHASVQVVDAQVIEEHIEDVKLQPLDKEIVENEKIIKVDDGTLEINETTVLELSSTAETNGKADESEEELTDNKITIVNSDNIQNDISKVTDEEEVKNETNTVSKEDTGLVTSLENKESSETNKIEEESKLKKFDITKLRAELEEAENISTNGGADIGTPTNGIDSIEEYKNVIEENTKLEKEITKTEVTKLDAGLHEGEKIIKDISIDESTVDNGNLQEDIIKIEENGITKENVEIENFKNNIAENEEQVSIEENLEAENTVKTFDITNLRAELEEVENISTESTNLNIPKNGKDTIGEITNGKEEIEESAEVEKDIKKVELIKLSAGLDAVEEVIKDIKIDSSTEEIRSSEINIVENEENADIAGNVEISSEIKQFDITKLRAELVDAENISTKSANLDTDIVEDIKKVKEDEITKDTIIDESTNDTRSPEKTITEEEIGKIEENIESENAAKTFDITKLRAELEEAENINTQNSNLDTSINGKDIVGEIEDDRKEIVETQESTEVETKIEKSEVTKLDAGLIETEEINKETIIYAPAENTGSSEKIITEEEIDKIEENVEAENAAKRIDIIKLETELDEAENINTKSTNLDTSINEIDIGGEIKDDKKENAETEKNTEVKKEIEKSDLTVTEEITTDTIINESTEGAGSSENTITTEEEIGKIEENVEAENAGNKFDITKLRAELEEAENINTKSSNLDTSINGIDIIGEIKDGQKENAKTEEDTEVKKEIEKSDITKLDTGLCVTEEITTDTIIEDSGSSEEIGTKEEEISKIEENVEVEDAGKKFDITKLRAELEEAENINTKSTNDIDIVGEIQDDKRDNAETVENTEIEKEIEKSEVTKLDAVLATTEELTKDTIMDKSTENAENLEKTITKKEEIGKIEENIKIENSAKQFDITKLRAELDEATGSNNQDTSINDKDIVAEIEDDKKENAETVESTKVEKEIKKSEVTKLGAGLTATEEITKDTIIDKSTDGTGSSEKIITEEEEIGKTDENVEAKKFDITKLRAELDEAEHINAKSTNLDTSINGKDIVGEFEDAEKENVETQESTKVEKEIEKTEVTKLDTGLAVTEEIIEDTEKNMTKKEENIEDSSEVKQFDITKLHAELDEAENINTKITNLDSPTNEKDIKNSQDENAETEESADVEKEIEKTETTKLDTGLAITEEPTEGTGSFEENIVEKKEDKTEKFQSELEEVENINTKITNLDTPTKGKDVIEDVKIGKEENVEIENSAEVEKEIEKTEVTKLGAELAVTEETVNDSSIDVSSEGYGSFEKEEKAKIEENIEVPCEANKFDMTKLRAELYDTDNINTEDTDLDTPTDGKDSVEENIRIKEDVDVENNAKKFDISKLRAELDDVELLNTEDKNVLTSADSSEEIKNSSSELNNVNQLNEEDSNKNEEMVKDNTTTNKFDLSKLHAELYDREELKEDKNLIENIDKTQEVITLENTKIEENEKANKFDLSKLRAELSEVDTVVKPTDEKELYNNDKFEPEKTNIENESHSPKEINSTSQLHLIDNEDNNDAIKSNTTNDVDHQLTVINNDIQDVNKNIKNENTLQLEPLHTTHSISGKEFEFIPTESSDNLIISPNDSNQSFSNKEVEPKINKEVMTNTNQESNFNQTLLNNETNSINRQDDMIDERAQSGISVSPDSDVTVIFNTNSLNKLDDNLVNVSGNSTPTDKTELETEESVVNDIGENLENKNKNSFDISKLRMEIENSSKSIQEQTEGSMSETNGDLKSTDGKTKDTAATLIQSVYRGYHVRNKLKGQSKAPDESTKEAPYSTDAFNLIQPKKEQDLKNEDFGISDALGNLLNQQLAVAAPNAVEVDKSGNQPEYIHIPLKGSIDESNSQLQHSGEFHDIFPISNLTSDVSENNNLDAIVTREDSNIKEDTNNSTDNGKKYDIVNEENLLKLHQAADGSVPQALEVVLNQQLAITTPCAKFDEKDQVDYIHIPLKDPNVVTDNNADVNFESQQQEVANNQTNNGLTKQETVESANINTEAITDLKQHNRSDAEEEEINEFVNNKKEESANNNVLVNYSFEPDGSIHDENMPMVVQNTQTSGSTMPVEVQPNQAPGAEILTSPTSVDETEASLIIENAEEIAQTSEKDASSKDEPTKNGAHLQTSMETSNRENTTLTEQNMENVAATKIQASFRGYQVRKQLKPKNGGVDSITLRRSLRRKSSGKLRGSENTMKKQMDKSADLEEKSATKIQAGIRGFLVRRRQTKAKNISQKSS